MSPRLQRPVCPGSQGCGHWSQPASRLGTAPQQLQYREEDDAAREFNDSEHLNAVRKSICMYADTCAAGCVIYVYI